MQRLFHKPDAESPLVEHPVSKLESLLEGPGFIWLDLLGEPAESIRALSGPLDLDRASLEEAIDISLLPRIDEHDRYVFVVLEGLTLGAAGRLETSELDLFVGEKFLITIHRDPFHAIEWCLAPGNEASTVGLDTPARTLAFLAQIGTRRYLPLLEALDERLEVLEEMAMASDPRTLTEVHALRRDVGLLRRSIGPQRDVFNGLAESLHPAIDPGAARAFDRVFDHHLKIVDSLDSARGLLASVLETHRGAVADQTNQIVRVLTVFSAVLLPMSVIAGIWGMNFVEIPLADLAWGFFIVVGAMLLLGLGLWFYFTHRRFVGGPDLSELPKSVGLGLVQIGAFPFKVVTSGVKQVGRIVGGQGEVGEPTGGDDPGPE